MNTNYGTLPILKQHSKNLEEALKGIEHGTFLSFEDLNTMAGIDVVKYRSVMESVKKTLLRDYNRLLINVRGKGYQVARPEQYSTVVDHGIKGIGRRIRGCKKIIEKVEWQKLDLDQTKKALESAGKTQVLSVVFKTTSVKKLSQNVDWGKLPSEESVVAFLLDRSKEAKI
jgi:hypothetical protein